MGILDRFRRRQQDRPVESDARGLFTARSGAVPPELVGGTREAAPSEVEDLWDRPGPAEPAPDDEPERRHELPVDGGSTADEPLFGGPEEAPAPAAPPAVDAVPPTFEHPPVAAEPAPEDLVGAPEASTPVVAAVHLPEAGTPAEGGRTMRVHDGRLDKRPGPIRMSPSEAIALAQDGPQALRRRTHPDG